MIQQSIETILNRYVRARTNEQFGGEHELFKSFEQIRDDITKSDALIKRPHIRVKFSAGQGNWARVPWIALLDSRETSTTQKGVYCVFLFRQDMSGVYITFNQGVTELINQNGRPRAHQELRRRAKDFQKYCGSITSHGFKLDEGIDLRADPGLGADYEYSTIAYKLYETGKVPPDSLILADMELTLVAYDNYMQRAPVISQPTITPIKPSRTTQLPKPFLLLAGISGTGKTRFVRQQATASAEQFGIQNLENYCLVPVRPDWHEPSDLLGYISRIGSDGPRYIVTDLLRFIVAAWKHTASSADSNSVTYKSFDTVCPFWLCLDEMNLAPIEQYFADYLSILETRSWNGDEYRCDPLMKADVIKQLDAKGCDELWKNLEIDSEDKAGLRNYFMNNGIPLPPNLIVAGTVNMDETTHGFSRKVIDRALTIDFGEFFPNIYEEFFSPRTCAKTLGFPRLSHAGSNENSVETVNFLTEINTVLAGTPFELAYRALNEILLAVASFKPTDETELQAVWDDFLMMKVLPRIEGDADKLALRDEMSLLTRLADRLKSLLPDIWDVKRPELLRENIAEGEPLTTLSRSKRKIEWMQKRLVENGFTTFWP
jgi:hypothetical protein